MNILDFLFEKQYYLNRLFIISYYKAKGSTAVRLIVFIAALAMIFASCTSTGQGGAAGQTDGQVNVPARSSRDAAGQIPVEKKVLVKFADGALDEYTISEYDAADVHLRMQNRYSASGTLLEQTEYTYQEATGAVSAKLIKDNENKLKSRIVYQYNDRNYLIKETFVNKSDKPVSSTEYAYDANGNRLSRIISNGAGVKLSETVYTFKDGLEVSSETKDGAGRKVSSAENQYDAEGHLISQKVYNASGVLTRLVNSVWEDGLEIQNEQTTPDGEVQLRVRNEYGAAGELLRRTIENIQGQSTQILEYEYTFRQGQHT
jgi:YD repeat-containing protein